MWARNRRWILPEIPDFHVAFRNLLHGRKSTTRDRRLYFPSEGRRAEDFFSPWKILTASTGFEPANLGTKGQHATSRSPKPLSHTYLNLPCRYLLVYFNNYLPQINIRDGHFLQRFLQLPSGHNVTYPILDVVISRHTFSVHTRFLTSPKPNPPHPPYLRDLAITLPILHPIHPLQMHVYIFF